MNKKGQLGTLQTLILTFVLIGIILGIGFLVIEELKEITGTTTTAVEAEYFTNLDNITAQYVDYNSTTVGSLCRYSSALVAAYNATTGSANASIELGNWTFTTTTGAIIVASNATGAAGEFNGTAIYINYTYTYGDEACEAIEDTETALGEIPTWFIIIVIIFIVGIILMIVFNVLPTGRGEGGMPSASTGGGGFFKGLFGKGDSGTTAQI